MQPSAFISYSHKDQKWLERLNEMLVPLVRGGLNIWSDQRIRPGDDWRKAIEDELAKATVAILLVSPAFLASEFIHNNELPPLLAAARQKGLRILWIPVSDCLHEKTPIAAYQAVHPPARPLDGLRRTAERNKALKAIGLEIEKALKAIALGMDQTLPPPPPAGPPPSFGAHLAGLSPPAPPRPLAALRERFNQLPMPRIIAALQRAIARCHPGQTLASRYPDCPAPADANGWDALEAYFADGKGLAADLLEAWQQALEEPAAGPGQVAAAARTTTTMAVVVHWDGDRSPGVRPCSYSTYAVDPLAKAYTPLAFSGEIVLDPRDLESAVEAIGKVVDTVLMACAEERAQPCVELFVPWWLLAADWSARVMVKNELNDQVVLLGRAPFVIRSADRLRMGNKLPDLEAKITPLQAGEGQWLPEQTAMTPSALTVAHTDASLVALRCVAPPAGPGVEEAWLKALLFSMVPLALWSTPESGLPETDFHGCLRDLGLCDTGTDGRPLDAPPNCPDLAAVPHHRYRAQAGNQGFSRLHLLLDTPLQPLPPLPAQSPA